MRLTVGISDMVVSTDPDDVIITYSLGSCVGLAVYDPEVMVGGIVHCMLPLSKTNEDKAKENPFMFVDTGVSALIQAVFDQGATRKHLVVKAVGASRLLDEKGMFKIGERNYTVLRKILWKNDILIAAEDVGGTKARTVYLEMDTGRTVIKSGGQETEL